MFRVSSAVAPHDHRVYSLLIQCRGFRSSLIELDLNGGLGIDRGELYLCSECGSGESDDCVDTRLIVGRWQ